MVSGVISSAINHEKASEKQRKISPSVVFLSCARLIFRTSKDAMLGITSAQLSFPNRHVKSSPSFLLLLLSFELKHALQYSSNVNYNLCPRSKKRKLENLGHSPLNTGQFRTYKNTEITTRDRDIFRWLKFGCMTWNLHCWLTGLFTSCFSVSLQPFEYDPLEKNRHKFMVQAMYAPEGEINQDVLVSEISLLTSGVGL